MIDKYINKEYIKRAGLGLALIYSLSATNCAMAVKQNRFYHTAEKYPFYVELRAGYPEEVKFGLKYPKKADKDPKDGVVSWEELKKYISDKFNISDKSKK